MKLLSITTKGFKSFADHTIINFPEKIIGVVGPNGCGKSNIADAIKWVFGEQSSKKLRGNSMDDVIFSGSQNRKATNFAEVTLLFDNIDRKINIDFNQIEITRRIFRGDGANHYFINQEPCRLKDIQELIMDSGLGKGSLGIISQGTVSSFAEAKAEDRRIIFEEAANVSKYKKRKMASIRKLERTESNLARVADILFELEKQYKPLKKQFQKAQKYITLKNELEDKEVTLLVYDILELQKVFDKATNQINSKKEELEQQTLMLNRQTTQLDAKREDLYNIDLKINKLQANLIDVSSKAENTLKLESIIEYQKNELVAAQDKPARILQLTKFLPNLFEENKINQEKHLLIAKDINQAKENLKLLYQSQKEIGQIINQSDLQINKLTIQKQLAENNLKKNSHFPYGVQSILKAKTAFPGYMGLVQELIKPIEGFELALAAAFGKQNHSLIVKTKQDAQSIIQFLKTNKSGRVTLLPLDLVKAKSIHPEVLIAAKQASGFVGPISDFITYPNHILPAASFVLGNILVAQDIEAAYEIATLVNKKLRVVSFDGQIINVGGSLTGGHSTPIKSKDNLEKLLNLIKEKLENATLKKNKLRSKLESLNTNIDKVKDEINIFILKQNKSSELIEAINSKIILLSNEYKKLSGKEWVNSDSNQKSTLVKYKNQINQVNFIREEIKALSDQKNDLLSQWKELEVMVKNQNKEIQGLQNVIHNAQIQISQAEIKLETNTQQLLTEYKLTFEFAYKKHNDFSNLDSYRDIVKQTRAKLDALGYVNLEALEQFIEIEKRYLKLKEQHHELTSAKKTIVNVISDMDKKMIDDFDTTFNKINAELQATFTRLFGGGSASLEYSDKDNILESGIEVKVKPPGKSITNLNLFSGGEKSLIALSVLFAILKVNPLPLVVLDEVEAPLDQVNIERFGDYLHNFSDKTQFIVITHRSGTMQKCDNIYGVTMQEQGVSKLVSINLKEAQKLAKELH